MEKDEVASLVRKLMSEYVVGEGRQDTANSTRKPPFGASASLGTTVSSLYTAERPTQYCEATWVDDNKKMIVKNADLVNGKPRFGWAMRHLRTTRAGVHIKTCMGVFKCPMCPYVVRPQLPPKQTVLGSRPVQPPRSSCPQHPDHCLIWKACLGGDPSLHRSLTSADKCAVQITYKYQDNGDVHLQNHGKHNHLRPPTTKPTAYGLAKLQDLVTNAPDLGPAQIINGKGSRLPITQIDPAFLNTDRTGYYKKQMLSDNGDPKNSVGFLLHLNAKNEKLFLKSDFLGTKHNAIHMQTDGKWKGV